MAQRKVVLTVSLVVVGLLAIGLVLLLANRTDLSQTAAISPAVLTNPTPTFSRITPTPTVALASPAGNVTLTSSASLTTQVVPTLAPPTQMATPNPATMVVQPPKATPNPPGSAKLSIQERAALTKLLQDQANLNSSLDRLDGLMTDVRPDLSSWYDQLDNEFQSWQNLLNYYKTTPMPGRIGSALMPDWLAALAHLQQAAQLLPQGYHQASGVLVSQGDQQVAYAQQELTYLNTLIKNLAGK